MEELKKEKEICPRKDCGREKIARRFKGSFEISICGNGHSWNQQEENEKRIKRQVAVAYEALDVTRLTQIKPAFGSTNPYGKD